MKQFVLLHGTVLTMNPTRDIIPDGGVAVSGGRITFVGTAQEAAAHAPGAEQVDCSGTAVLPGFLDAGGDAGHSFAAGTTGGDPAANRRAVMQALPSMGQEFWEADAVHLAQKRLLAGVTTGVVNYPLLPGQNEGSFWDTVSASLSAAYRTGIRLSAGIGYSPAYDHACYADYGAMHKQRFRARLYAEISPPGGARGEQDFARVLRTAADCSLPVTAEAHRGGLLRLPEQDPAVSGVPVAVRDADGLEYPEVELMRRFGWSYLHLPRQDAPGAPLAELLEEGVDCAVMYAGGQYHGNMDPLHAARRAQMIQQIRFDDLNYLPAARQLELITCEAARALGIDDVTGSLETGKYADITVFSLEQARTTPHRSMPVHRMMMDGSVRQVRDVFVGGRQLVSSGRLACADAFTAGDFSSFGELIVRRAGLGKAALWGRPYPSAPGPQERRGYNA